MNNRYTGWPFHLFKTSCWLQNKSFVLAWPALTRPKRNFCLEVNGRFWTSGMVTLWCFPFGHSSLIFSNLNESILGSALHKICSDIPSATNSKLKHAVKHRGKVRASIYSRLDGHTAAPLARSNLSPNLMPINVGWLDNDMKRWGRRCLINKRRNFLKFEQRVKIRSVLNTKSGIEMANLLAPITGTSNSGSNPKQPKINTGWHIRLWRTSRWLQN